MEPLRRFFDLDELPFDIEPFAVPGDGELEQGAIIRSVSEDSPAAEAGLQEGDVVTAVDGEPVEGPQELVAAVAERVPGDVVTLTVYRSDDEGEQEIEVTLAENPEAEGEAYLGVHIGGFFRLRRFEGGELPEEMGPLHRFFDLDELPFDWDNLRRRFEFRLPPDPSEQEPCCSGENVL
jgi:hypothetical protein